MSNKIQKSQHWHIDTPEVAYTSMEDNRYLLPRGVRIGTQPVVAEGNARLVEYQIQRREDIANIFHIPASFFLGSLKQGMHSDNANIENMRMLNETIAGWKNVMDRVLADVNNLIYPDSKANNLTIHMTTVGALLGLRSHLDTHVSTQVPHIDIEMLRVSWESGIITLDALRKHTKNILGLDEEDLETVDIPRERELMEQETQVKQKTQSSDASARKTELKIKDRETDIKDKVASKPVPARR